jgi:FAD/FMN-containing dehydrogenase
LTAAAAVPAPAVVTAPAGQVGAALQDALRAFGRLPPVEHGAPAGLGG